MAWLLNFLRIRCALACIAWATKPKHIGTRFTRIPPVVARVNTPPHGATPEMRRINLPTGDQYLIPAH